MNSFSAQDAMRAEISIGLTRDSFFGADEVLY